MKTTIPRVLTIGALTLALAACNNDGVNDADTAGPLADNAAIGTDGTMGGADGALVDTRPADGMDGAAMGGDRTALAMVTAVDEHEIAAAEMAQAKDIDDDVEDYADMLVEDHTRNLEKTRTLAANVGTGTGMGAAGTGTDMGATGTSGADMGMADTAGMGGADNPDLAAMRSKHQSERERLAALDGDEFETAWLDAMVAGHQEALTMLDDRLIPGATDDQVRQHLTDTRTAIANHLQRAEELRGQR